VARRIRIQCGELREISARVFVEWRADDVAESRPEQRARGPDERRGRDRNHCQPLSRRARDHDIDRHRGERRQYRVLLRHHRERIRDHGEEVQPPLSGAQPQREEPQRHDREERREQDGALDEVGDRVHGDGVEREETHGDPPAPATRDTARAPLQDRDPAQ
jgi:hypothetical protein